MIISFECIYLKVLQKSFGHPKSEAALSDDVFFLSVHDIAV